MDSSLINKHQATSLGDADVRLKVVVIALTVVAFWSRKSRATAPLVDGDFSQSAGVNWPRRNNVAGEHHQLQAEHKTRNAIHILFQNITLRNWESEGGER